MSNDDHAVISVWTILKTLQWTTRFFKKHQIDSARSDAEILLAHTLKCERIDLYLYHDKPLQVKELGLLKSLIRRRIRHEPIAYIVGMKEFWSLEFHVTTDVLIPRPETEGLVESALQFCSKEKGLRVLELGVGSGVVSIALANERPHWKFWALDISQKAIDIARLNAHKHIQDERIVFMVGSWFDAIRENRECFDLIVSNPPYVKKGELHRLVPDVALYEPIQALDGGPGGLDCIALIIHAAGSYMKSGGLLLIEIGYNQGDEVQDLAMACGVYKQVKIEKDLSGHDRRIRLEKK